MFQIPENPKHHACLDLEVVMKAASVFPADCSLYFLFAHHHCTSLRPFSHEDRSPGQDEVASVSSLREELFRIATESQKERRGGKNGGRTKISERTLKEKLLIHFDSLSSNFINLYSLFGICFAIFWFEDLILHSALMEHLEGAASRKTMTCICCALFLDGS